MEANGSASASLVPKTTTIKYALSDGMTAAARADVIARGVQYATFVVLILAIIPVSAFLTGNYDHLFKGKLFPALMLSLGIDILAAAVIFGIVRFVSNAVEKNVGKRLQNDVLTKRIAEDFNVPTELVADALADVAGHHSGYDHFTHGANFYTVKFRSKFDEQIEDHITHVKVTSAPAKSISKELIVP